MALRQSLDKLPFASLRLDLVDSKVKIEDIKKELKFNPSDDDSKDLIMQYAGISETQDDNNSMINGKK